LTKNFDTAVKPVPILQVINVIVAIICLAYEWPLRWVAGTHLHRSIVARLLWLPLATLSAVLLYQTTNAALYYFIGCGVYFWAYSEGEVSDIEPSYIGCDADEPTGDMCCSLDIAQKIRSQDQAHGRGMMCLFLS
jgi:hypothetical protein